uniref:ATP synthase F0 subunit 6 n=1 Tax=Scolytoplatypus wugongshanensis TaxID=2894162 RepID=UPI0023AA803B|nr:ATP synthase F0 subunit 6 [Scolytoplatypus wugongshanensis]WCB99739.1 ATP synthase F0 subunit 6 [Scolytoplatypus wugongshanensis]
MMSNLFSSFDPSTSFYSFNWVSSFILILVLPSILWLIPSRWNYFWTLISFFIHNEFKILLSKFNKGSSMIFTTLFLMILINNFMGLFPYIFTSSSHMNFTMTFSIPLWLTFMLFGWMNKSIHMFAHLVPQGAPSALLPFLVIIESVSNLIRPGTLAIRLSANMIAGHLLLTLLGNLGSAISNYFISLLIITQILLLILESAVSMIQAYVFSILITLYSSEIT